jgi:hypothetical protein
MSTDTGAGSSKATTMRRFILRRVKDASGVSGLGVVAEGIEWSNGRIALHWISQLEAVNDYANAKVLTSLHGHGGDTVVEWIDP